MKTHQLSIGFGILIEREGRGVGTERCLRFFIGDTEYSIANVVINVLACSHYHVTRSDAFPILNEDIFLIRRAAKSISPLDRAISRIHPREGKLRPDHRRSIQGRL